MLKPQLVLKILSLAKVYSTHKLRFYRLDFILNCFLNIFIVQLQ